MDDIIKNAPISVSIIDYLGKIEDGVGILMCIVSNNETYELGYWFNKEGHIRIVPEQKLLDKLNISDIYKYDKINEFIYFIHNNLKDPDKILNEFLNK
jgi:hypothetical protein